MGPLVSEEQLQRVTGFLESGVAEGATTLTGGWGREMGHEVLEAYTEVKAVTTQL
jgi:acyl-CoA reductase-like NAD-dependent aldehyde dehydrogenase